MTKPFNGKHILCVDDDPANLALLEIFLAEKGATVGKSSNGSEALEVVLKMPPHLIITDTNMPEMCGVELIKKVRANGLKVPIINYFSGCSHCPDTTETEILKLGAAVIFKKPYDMIQLHKACLQLLGE